MAAEAVTAGIAQHQAMLQHCHTETMKLINDHGYIIAPMEAFEGSNPAKVQAAFTALKGEISAQTFKTHILIHPDAFTHQGKFSSMVCMAGLKPYPSGPVFTTIAKAVEYFAQFKNQLHNRCHNEIRIE